MKLTNVIFWSGVVTIVVAFGMSIVTGIQDHDQMVAEEVPQEQIPVPAE